MTSLCLHPVRFILTSSMVLTFLIRLVKIYLYMFPLPIIHRMCDMSFSHLITERTNLSSQIHSISHLSFLETQRVKFFVSHQPLFIIHQIMRMPLSILHFLIVVVVIFSLILVIMILIHLLLIILSHRYLMVHLLMKWKLLKLLMNFILR